MSVIGYARTALRSEEAIEEQRMRIQRWCDARGRQLRVIFADNGVSGSSTVERPQLSAALASLRPSDCLLVCDLGRVSRSTSKSLAVLTQIQSAGCDFACVDQPIDTTQPGDTTWAMVSAFNRFNRE